MKYEGSNESECSEESDSPYTGGPSQIKLSMH